MSPLPDESGRKRHDAGHQARRQQLDSCHYGSVLAGKLNGSVTVTGQAVVTSGNYEKYFEENGKRYHHILDPCTGAPSESDVVSTTIIADKGIDCDALSTATFLMGADAGMQLIDSLDGIEAVFIQSDGSVVTSKHIDKYQLQVNNS